MQAVSSDGQYHIASCLIRQEIRDWTIQPRIFYVLCVMSV